LVPQSAARFSAVLGFHRRLSRALRVLMACVALVTAAPSARAAVPEGFRPEIALVEQREVVAQVETDQLSRVRHPTPPGHYTLESIRAALRPSEPYLETRLVFLLNCRWLC
jgi:hypothetical protein